MKKKVKDLTVGKLYEYCKEKESCDDCPFRNFNYYCTLNTPYDLEEDALEQEVEIPEEEAGGRGMITYESLKELAQALSVVTGYRYVAFRKSFYGDLLSCFSNCKMLWHATKKDPFGDWANELDCGVLPIKDLPFLDWSKCQFDCKEADNE